MKLCLGVMAEAKQPPAKQAPLPPTSSAPKAAQLPRSAFAKLKLVDEGTFVQGTVYNALAVEYVRTRKEHRILKQAVKQEREEKEALSENMYNMSKLRRELDLQKRAAEEEIDRLAYENERLKRRVKAMVKQFKEQEKGMVKSEQNQTSMFGKLIGSAAEVENEKLAKDIEILQEELRIKIEENECVHIKQWELQQEHERAVADIKAELKALRKQVVDYEKQAVSKNKCILELGEEKERHLKRRIEVEEKFEEIQGHLAERESAMKEINIQLKTDLDFSRSRLKQKVIFDDSRVPEWAGLNVPPHNEQFRRKRHRSSQRALALLGQICNTYDEYASARGALIRLQLHHPTFSSASNPFTKQPGGGNRFQEKNELPENIVSQLTTSALAWHELHGALTAYFEEDASGAKGTQSSNSATLLSSLSNLVSLNEELTESEIEYFEDNREDGSEDHYPKALRALLEGFKGLHALVKQSLASQSFSSDTAGGVEGGDSEKLVECIASIARKLRTKATLEAKILQAERKQPFVPQPVRTACIQVEKATFHITSLSERFVESTKETFALLEVPHLSINQSHSSFLQRLGTPSKPKTIAGEQNAGIAATSKAKLTSLRERGREYSVLLQRLGKGLGESIPQGMARSNKTHLDKALEELASLKGSSGAKIDQLNSRVVILLEQMDQERKIRQSAEQAMKLSQSNLAREKEERSIVELSLNDSIRRLRQEVSSIKARGGGVGAGGAPHTAPMRKEQSLYDGIQGTIMSALAHNLKDIFDVMDGSGDGIINQSQLKAAFERLNITLSEDDVSTLYKSFDKNGDHTMAYEALLSFLSKGSGILLHDQLSSIETNGSDANVTKTNEIVQSSAPVSQHEKRFGSFEYTMSAIDPDGRVLSTLKVSDNDFSREEEIRHHYEERYVQYENQIALASSKAKEVFAKYKDSVDKLKQLAAERSSHLQLLKKTQDTAKKAREELTATREAMANQSQMLTSRVLSLEEGLSKTKKKLSYVCAHTMRCDRCHGKNRVSYVLMEGKCRTCGTDVPFIPPQRNVQKRAENSEKKS